MPETPDKFFLTTPIYYVNARPHIGHAYTTIVADVLARRARAQGIETWFLTGTDEHGQKIERSAQAAGVPPQQFTNEVSASFQSLWNRMGITYNDFIRTTSARHQRGAQKLFATLYERGFIYLSTYTGSYCVSDEAFVDLPAGTPCPDCGRPLETVTEENFFFKLSEFQQPLLDLIETDGLLITPDSARNEVLSFLRGGLKDLSVSRSSFTWGIPVPEPAASTVTQKHVIYVWLDALANYMTALGYGAGPNGEDGPLFHKFWPAGLHLVGKEITRFHCVYWPAFLMAAGIDTPKAITANGWLLFDNSKMSKSKGNVVRTETILDAFGPLCPNPLPIPDPTENLVILSEAKDPCISPSPAPQSSLKQHQDLFASDILRYFLLREIPFGQDGSFSFDALITRYNADLANGYGNLVSRTLKMIQSYLGGELPVLDNSQQFAQTTEERERFASEAAFGRSNPLRMWSDSSQSKLTEEYDVYEHAIRCSKIAKDAQLALLFNVFLGELVLTITTTDRYISDHAPWKLAKSESEADRQTLRDVLAVAAESIRIITALLYPILPYATASVWRQLGLGDIEVAARNGELKNLQWGGLQPGTKLGPLSPIFPRADKGLAQKMSDIENPQPPTEQIACVTGPNDPPSAKLSAITEAHDATHPATDDLPVTSLASEQSVPVGVSSVLSPSFDPAAPPRTTTLPEPNPGAHVAASTAITTERPGTPPHTEAHASGIFAAQPTDQSPQITIDDFARIDLRVARIVVAERIPKADKLLRLEVDLGYETRQILSGIAEWYTPEELVGRRIVVIANLAPRKMRGLESHGMLLAASTEGGKPHLATFTGADSLPLGSRLK